MERRAGGGGWAGHWDSLMNAQIAGPAVITDRSSRPPTSTCPNTLGAGRRRHGMASALPDFRLCGLLLFLAEIHHVVFILYVFSNGL